MRRSNKDCGDDDDEKSSMAPPPRDADSGDDEEAVRHNDKNAAFERKVNEGKATASRSVFVARSATKAPPVSFATMVPPSVQQQPTIDGQHAHRQSRIKSATGGVGQQSSTSKQPGAVQEPGFTDLPEDELSPVRDRGLSDAFAVSNATLVADEVNIVDAEVMREDDFVIQRADELAKQVLQQLRETDQSSVNKSDNGDTEVQQRKRLIRIIGGILALVVVVVLIVVVVLLTRPTSSSAPSPTPGPVQPKITPAPSTAPPTMVPSNPCGDFPCSSNLTVMELVNMASSHTRLMEYLNRESNWELRDFLSSEENELTLFAPTDESFEALPLPYLLYFQDNVLWRRHLMYVLATNILTKVENKTDIFQSFSLPTYRSGATLTVDQVNNTIENGASIVVPDIRASNGNIQVPDKVIIFNDLWPSLLDCIVRTDYGYSRRITKFRQLLLSSGLETQLEQNLVDGLTVFVPEDDAFNQLDENMTALLFEVKDAEALKNFIFSHMLDLNLLNLVPGAESTLWMMSNLSAWFTNNNPSNDTHVNTASLIDSYYASNGFIHVIDQLLLPSSLGELLRITSIVTTDYNCTTFFNIVQDHAQLGSLLNGIVEGHPNLGRIVDSTYLTVFAPLERAFELVDQKLLSRLLEPGWLMHLQSLCLNHFSLTTNENAVGSYLFEMLSGFNLTLRVLEVGTSLTHSNITVDGVQVETISGSIRSLLGASDGIIRFIDDVLLPPWVNESVFDKLSGNQNVSAFLKFVQSFKFQSLLNSTDRGFTVLAPNNAAMSNRTNQNISLQEFVSRHIIIGNSYTSILGSTVASVANKTLNVVRAGNRTSIGGALIVQQNILASNGLIHVIDRVL